MLVGIVFVVAVFGGVSALAHWTMQADPDGADDKSKKDLEDRAAYFSQLWVEYSTFEGIFDPISGAIISSELQRLYDEITRSRLDEAKALHGEDTLRHAPEAFSSTTTS